jgi:hypothetical protein
VNAHVVRRGRQLPAEAETKMREFKLFFSNRNKDQKKVDELQSVLRKRMPQVPFSDVSKDLPQSTEWEELALPLLKSCDAVVCVIGKDTKESEPVEWEVRQAQELGKPLFAARLHPDCEMPLCEELGIEVDDWNTKRLAKEVVKLVAPKALFPGHDWDRGAPSHDAIWNQYSMMVQSWESLIARRQTVNTLYVSATAALLAVIGAVISTFDKTGIATSAAGVAVLSLLGAALSFNWRRTLVSYGILSAAKSDVVHALEEYMPARLFDAEWQVLESKRYTSTTKADTQSATFFMLLFLAIALVAAGVAVAGALP